MLLRHGIIRTSVLLGLCAAAFGESLWVPVVAHTPGVGDSRWRSDVGVLNLCTSTATVELRLHTSAGIVSRSFIVPAASQQIFENVVAQLIDGDGAGPLEVVSDQALSVTSRTYNLSADGSFGQSLGAVDPADGLAAGQAGVLQQLREDGSFRSNLGVLNTGSANAEVAVELLEGSGALVGSYQLELEPAQLIQDNRPYLNRFGRDDIIAGYARVSALSGTGVLAYASVIDAATGDPTTIELAPMPDCEPPGEADYLIEVYDPQRAYNGTTLLGQIGTGGAPVRIVEVDMNGRITWELELPQELAGITGGVEVQTLDNGNLLTMFFGRGIYELSRSGEILWSQPVSRISHDADRLDNGNTLYVFGMGDGVGDAQVTEIDAGGNTVWQWFAADAYGVRFQGVEREGWTHINAVQRLANGTTLVSLRNFDLSAVVDTSGDVLWEIDWTGFGASTDPHEPVLLPDGHLLVCLQRDSPYQAVEIDTATGDTVWTYAHPSPLRTARDCDRLPNGNTLMVAVRDEGDGSSGQDLSTIIEVTPDGDVVWQLTLEVPADGTPGYFFKAERVGSQSRD